MQLRTIATFAVAIVLGLVAVILVRNSILSGQSAVNLTTVPVVVTAQPIQRDTPLQAAMFKVVNYPRDGVPAGSFHTVQEFIASGGGNRTAQRDLAVNEIILAENATGSSENSSLSRTLEAGKRAVSIRSSDVAGVGGFIVPGDRIDVLATHASAQKSDVTVTETLAQNLRVLGVDQTSSVEASKPNVAKAITVEATPEQAAAISLAQLVGSVTLVLRKPHDTTEAQRRAITLSNMSTGEPAAAPHTARVSHRAPSTTTPAAPQVHVVRGVETTNYPATGA